MSALVLTGSPWADQAPSKKDAKPDQAETKKQKTDNTEIQWLKYDEGLQRAKKEGKKVFVEFTAQWCGFCRRMRATTFRDPEIIGMLNDNYISVSVDGDSRDTLNIEGWITSERALARQYRVSSYPTFWFLTPDADPIAPVKGYRDSQTLSSILDYLKDDLYKTVSFQDYLEKKQKK